MVTDHMAIAAARIRHLRHQGSFEVVPRQPTTPPINPPSPAYLAKQAAIYKRVRSIAP